MTLTPAPKTALRCRTIRDDEIDAVVALLVRGFPDRSDAYWRKGLARHLRRDLPENYPRLGYVLETAGRLVGVLLTLHTTVETEGQRFVRCNLSSWYVEPDYRNQGTLLDKVAMRRPEVTYVNVSPAPHTWAIQEARGFVRYCAGQMLVLPALTRVEQDTSVRAVGHADALDDLSEAERITIRHHLDYGCIAIVGTDRQGVTPFLFRRRTIGMLPHVKQVGQIGCLQLIGGDAENDLPRFAGAIGRLLLRRHATPWIVVDAQTKIPGLVGRFFPGRAPKYAHGPHAQAPGDLTYTELVLFGP